MSNLKFWISEINWKKVFLCGVIYTVLSMVVRQIEVLLTMGYYKDPAYFGVWSKLMMPNAGPPPAEFMITSLIFQIVVGISLAIIYYYLRSHLPKETKSRTFYFADLMVAANFIFFVMPVYMLFNVPFGLLVSWFISGFIILLAQSIVMVKVIR